MPAPASARNQVWIPILMVLMAAMLLAVRWEEPMEPAAPKVAERIESELEEAELDSLAAASLPSPVVKREEIVPARVEEAGYGVPMDTRVRVGIELTTREEVAGHPPQDCEGWTITVQTWTEETLEVEHHTTTVDGDGVATMVFQENVHVDWVACTPPESSGYAHAIVEDHENVHAGEHYQALVFLDKPIGASGRVVDEQGFGVGGAVVHVYSIGNMPSPAAWYPGSRKTTTDGSGYFQFPRLPFGQWGAAVEPHPWWAIDPMYGDEDHGKGAVDLRSEFDPMGFGELTVRRQSTTVLRVVDAGGRPMPGVWGYFMPGDHATGEAWEDYSMDFVTDSEGAARFSTPGGRWRADLDLTYLSLEEHELDPIYFHSGDREVHFRLPIEVGKVEGRLVFPDGRPAAYADLTLQIGTQEDHMFEESWADARGMFRFTNIDASLPLHLTAASNNDIHPFISRSWEVRANTEPLELTVLPGLPTLLRLIPEGGDFSEMFAAVDITAWCPIGEDGEPVGPWVEVLNPYVVMVPESGLIQLPPMAPGRLRCSFEVRVGSADFVFFGEEQLQLAPWSTFEVQVGLKGQEVPIDLRR